MNKWWQVIRASVWGFGLLYSFLLAIYLVLRVLLKDAFWWLSLAHTLALWLFVPLFIISPLFCWFSLRYKRWGYVAFHILLVGIAFFWLFHPIWRHKTVVVSTRPTITVVNLNMWDGSDTAPMVTWLNAINADVVAVHETLGRNLGNLLAQYPYVHLSNADTRLFSRHPILVEDKLRLENRPPTSIFLPRIEIEVSNQRIAIYGVHLVNPQGPPRLPFLPDVFPYHLLFGYDDSRRDKQVDYLLSYIQSEEYPFVVLGDFNISHTSLDYDHLASYMTDAYAVAGDGFGFTWPIKENSLVPPLLRLDYVWYGNGLRAIWARNGPYLGSDHLPVTAQLELP